MENQTATPQFGVAEFHEDLQDSHSLFMRGVLFGIGGAVLGIIIYSTVAIATGFEIGLVSVAVGFVVGRAILLGSRNRRGRRYQIVAALLTYAAVSMSAVPVALSHVGQLNKEVKADATESAAATPPAAEETKQVSLLGAIGMLTLIGLASPFLGLYYGGASGIIGLVILFVGIQVAWRMTGDAAATVQQALRQEAMRPMGQSDDKPTSLNLNR